MIDKLNQSENLLGVVLMTLGLCACVLASYWHDDHLMAAGTGIITAGALAFKGARSNTAN